MVRQGDIAVIQASIDNRLEQSEIGDRSIAGVIGDAPSHYSKSPALWNAAFRLLGMHAVYLPFDIKKNRLKDLTQAMRDSDRFLGVNVTVPHKLRIMEYLDELDPGASRIQAVNTIVRAKNGRLLGYNTDGEGFVDSLLKPQPGQTEPFLASLKGMNVLVIGAGGSARAVAFHLADLLEDREILICNRTLAHAESLAFDIRKMGRPARAIPESELATWARRVGLIVNSTTKGQGGMGTLENGKMASMEPYSALAPAHPVAVFESDHGKTPSDGDIAKANEADIQQNNRSSLELAQSLPKTLHFYDLIYFPQETVFLRHARLTGHPTMNGKAMIINQAVIAFCKHICRAELDARGINHPDTQRRILEVMYRAW
jgi:shikimate dehydrogenase